MADNLKRFYLTRRKDLLTRATAEHRMKCSANVCGTRETVLLRCIDASYVDPDNANIWDWYYTSALKTREEVEALQALLYHKEHPGEVCHITVVHADLLPRKKEHRAKSLKLREETLEAFKTFLSKHDPERYKLFCKYESAAEWETVFYSEGDEDTW